MYGAMVNGKSLKGFFLIQKTEATDDLLDLLSLYIDLRASLFGTFGEDVQIEGPFKVRSESGWITSRSNDAKSFEMNGTKFSFIPQKALPIFEQGPRENLTAIDFKTWLVENSKLSFDVYLNFEINKKCIHYLRVGNLVSKTIVEKFSQRDTGFVLIPITQRSDFLAYCLEAVLTTPLSPALP